MTMIKIGDIELKGRVVLGPMAGVTTLAYRDFMKPFGVALSYSEMISDCGIDYKNRKTYSYLATSNIDRPVGLQLFGFDKEKTVKAIKIIEEKADYDILDINLGCPVFKVVKTGAGSSWLSRPAELEDYMKAVVAASHKPVTAKIRLGKDSNSINVWEVAKMLEGCGIKMLTVHARTAVQGYSGVPDFEAIRDLGKSLSIPLCISGDIFTADAAIKAMEITGAELVMVARGGLGNPRLITNINNRLEGKEELPAPTIAEQTEWALAFSKALIEEKGERVAIMELRGLIPHFFNGFPGYKKIRAEISVNIKTKEDLFRILNGILNRNRL